jgi:hypothetical protein
MIIAAAVELPSSSAGKATFLIIYSTFAILLLLLISVNGFKR